MTVKQLEKIIKAKIISCIKEFSLPYNSTYVDVKNIRMLLSQGRTSIIYSFVCAFSSKGSNEKKELILKVFNKTNREKARKEFALLNILKEHNLPVPVAFCFEEHDPVLKKSFMIMESIMAKDASFYLSDEKAAKRVIKEMAEYLVKIHNVDLSYVKNSDFLFRQLELRHKSILAIRSFINSNCSDFLGFCPPSQRRFIAAVKRLGHSKPKKVPSALVHLDYEPNHVLILNEHCIIVDWGEASVGDPAYDVAWTYHKLRLGREKSKIDLGEYFVKCYEKFNGRKLINLQFFKDMVAIEMAKWSGLSPFGDQLLKNYRKLLLIFFGDIIGGITRMIYVRKMRRLMKGHHTPVWRNINYIQSYALRYLEKDRYTTINMA